MSNTFFTSDTHFGHTKILDIRPWDSLENMHEALIENWNSVVNPGDKVYHLGDVCLQRKYLPLLKRLNGKKILIKGNHDIYSAKDYLEYFKDIQGCVELEGMMLTHIPVHESELQRFKKNIHGHLHCDLLYEQEDPWCADDRYINVCVENTNYTPISLEKIKKFAT